MKSLWIILVVAVVLVVRISVRLRRRRAHSSGNRQERLRRKRSSLGPLVVLERLGDTGIIARREIRERVRGRIFQVGTLLLLIVVALAIIIPALNHGSSVARQRVGVVGGDTAAVRAVLQSAAVASGDEAEIRDEPTTAAADAALRSNTLDLAVIDGREVVLKVPASSSSSSADSTYVTLVADDLGVLQADGQAGLTSVQARTVDSAHAVLVHALASGAKPAAAGGSVIGLILLFVMLTQYDTWILLGVMQEKSSRVVEVLLATVRPIELLGGKVLGIGLVALGQAALVVGVAVAALAAATGSDLLHGSAPVTLLAELLWLILGYALYCWVFAAAGSTAERQDQVQTLALPLTIPILVGYVFSITVVGTGHPDVLFRVLAYVPLTAPFCMSALVAIGDVAWWQFVIAVVLTLAATAATAQLAARIYQRAVLQTGSRVRLLRLVRSAG